MADDRLRRLERRLSAEPTTDALVRVLTAKHRSGLLPLSKQNIDLMASLGIAPAVTAFLGGPTRPESKGILSYQCLSGVQHLRGCWRSFPHQHPEDVDHDVRVLQRSASQARRKSTARKVPAKIGWTQLSVHDLHWLAKRIHKAGWRVSVTVLYALYQRCCRPVSIAQAQTEWEGDVERLIGLSWAAARDPHPLGPGTMKHRALELTRPSDQTYSMVFGQDHHRAFLAWAVQIIAKQQVAPERMAERIADYRARGMAIPTYWERALAHPERRGNRNRIFGGHPLTALVMLVQHHLLPTADVHAIMQDAVFEFYTGHRLLR